MILTPTQLAKLPQSPGVYRFFDSGGTILYIGKAINLKRRVSSYFQKTDHDAKTAQLVPQVRNIEVTTVNSEFEALLLEAELIKKHLPKYNVIWKDDKHYIYIKITKEEFPRILFSRQEDEVGAQYFGPFPSKRVVKDILSYVRSIIPYCTQNATVRRACFYTHIGLCDPCPAVIRSLEGPAALAAKRRYREHLKRISALLSGDIDRVKRLLTADMEAAARQDEFEEAARCRDRLRALDVLLQTYHAPEEYMKNPALLDDIRRQESVTLKALLLRYYPHITTIQSIECYDISNISGTSATGSMVTFVNGEPDKNRYRRFRIRGKKTPDDFAMMREMIGRRLKHTEWPLPDLLVIDGGKPQLRAIRTVLTDFSLSVPVIGLAKQLEEIVVPTADTFIKLDPPTSSPAIHLLQRIRDEAHRFAHRYHEVLRLKKMFLPPVSGAR